MFCEIIKVSVVKVSVSMSLVVTRLNMNPEAIPIDIESHGYPCLRRLGSAEADGAAGPCHGLGRAGSVASR